ncbi:MAG: radical SAM family heme chaperone HemW [Clostridium sp.]|uniref:radical SAM family heme chaperone HemW n=1 Tax=Clostridium sp. TaxID=1506 RepID=UPI002FC685C1
MKSLYVHIPFCARKCLYCDFNSITDRSLENEYIERLITEIERLPEENFKTIFIGGGTPTILSIENLEKLLTCLKKYSPIEFSVECNPGTLNEDNLTVMKKQGINRLSIGLQSSDNHVLKKLGRIHSYEEFLESYRNARKLGFNNINIDLMFAVPGQSFEMYKDTLDRIVSLNPEHLSAYSLIVEEGTPYFTMREKGKLTVVDEDIEREMYDYTIEFLQSRGYKWYEISNFAKNNLESKHNVVYWSTDDYYGVGAGAHSYVNRYRYSNPKSIGEYIAYVDSSSNIYDKEYIDESAAMEEFVFLGMRMMKGISKEEFNKRFNKNIYSVYKDQIEKLTRLGLIEEVEDRIKLTRRGVSFSNSVFVEFLL